VHPEGEHHLARRRPGQELTQRDQLGVAAIVEPGPALDELGPQVAEVRDRSAERQAAEAQERQSQLTEPGPLRSVVVGVARHRPRA
jgi:hypothetical protein